VVVVVVVVVVMAVCGETPMEGRRQTDERTRGDLTALCCFSVCYCYYLLLSLGHAASSGRKCKREYAGKNCRRVRRPFAGRSQAVRRSFLVEFRDIGRSLLLFRYTQQVHGLGLGV
jgi:hypothetical protein